VRVSDPDLTLRILREFRDEMRLFRRETNERFEQIEARFTGIDARFDRVESRLGTLELTVNGMAGHLLGVTHFVKTIDRRVRKLETRAAK
jgi:hypothetical protein